MQVNKVGMNRNHFEPGDASRIRMVVMHSTAAAGPGDFNYLRNGGSDKNPVSIHYYIGKNGAISQMVDDQNIAWQAGVSAWRIASRLTLEAKTSSAESAREAIIAMESVTI